MNRWIRSKTSTQVHIVFLWSVALLLFLSACDSPSNSRSIFDQSPTPSERSSTNQPLSAQNLSHLHPLWSYTFAPDAPDKMAVANGIVYMTAGGASSSYLVAIQDAKRLWRYQPPDPTQRIADFLVSGDIVYLNMETTVSPSTKNAIYAVNVYTGRELWHYSSENVIHHLAYADARLYFDTNDEAHALDVKTGKLQWSYQFSDGSRYSPSSPFFVAVDGNLYLSLWTSPYRAGLALAALDGRTGRVQWQRSEVGDTFPFLLVENGIIYRRVRCGSNDQVSAFNAKTGKELWNSGMGLPGEYARENFMDVAHNVLYLQAAGLVQAFDMSTGHLIWSTGASKGKGDFFIGPIVGNGLVYVGTETPVGGWHPLFQPPVRAREWLYALDAQSGKLVRLLQDDDSFFRPEVLRLDNEHLYVSGSRSSLGLDETAKGKPDLYALGI